MAAPMISICCLGIILFLSSISCFEDEFEGSRTLTLEHSFDQGPDPIFSKRGTVIIRSVSANRAMFSQHMPLSTGDRSLLKTVVEDGGIYRIRIPIREGEEDSVFVSTFCKACSVYESSLSDNIVISVDQSGEILGVSFAANGYCSGVKVPSSNLSDWNTKVDISVTVTGPVPDTQSYIDKIKREESDKAKGAQADNRSFFSKYWMYIVPFVIMMFVMQSMDPQQGGGGGGGR